MLEGITILNQTEIFITKNEYTTPIISMFIITIICTIISSFAYHKKNNILSITSGFVGIISFIILAYCVYARSIIIPTGEYEYQVIVDDNVSINDFNEKYEIIKIEGKIYTIRER